MEENKKKKYIAPTSEEATPVSKELLSAMQEALAKATETINSQKEQINSEHDKYVRALADYQNLQRNSSITISKSKETGKISVFKELLPIMDNFEKALEAGEVTEGVELIYNGLKSVFISNGIEVINPSEGESFDDSIHEAVAPIPGTEEQKNTIAFTQFKGYRFGDNILRYAKVGVYI